MDNAFMNAMLENPDMLRAIMQADPTMHRLMESNPQLAQALNNPSVLRDAMRAMSSPV
jgi:hypothetical protein